MFRLHSAPPVSPTSLQLSPPPTKYLPSPRIVSGHSKVSSLTTWLQHIPTDSKLTPKSISRESQEKHEVQARQVHKKPTRKISCPYGEAKQGRLGLQFINPGTHQLLKDLLIGHGHWENCLRPFHRDLRGLPPKSPTPLQTAMGNLGPAEAGRGVEAGWGVGPRFPSNLTCAGDSPSSQEGRSGEDPDQQSFSSSHPVGHSTAQTQTAQ